ncbi:MAG: 3-mercaptopyruvate sulfurtransferase [Rhodospirillales bacterium]|nr:3-mercaptopyruvate sulfurtransferase [Rhodospirillales bacterium]
MEFVNPEALVSTEWLAAHLKAPDVRVVDATFFLPGQNRNALEEYDACHIPGAVFFNIDEIADPGTDLPHMLPSPERFSSQVRKLGLGDGNRIIVYDANGFVMAAARVWWMFRVFGHDDVAVLDGGLPKWLREGRPTEDLPPVPRARHFTARVNSLLVRDRAHLLANIESGREQVADARSVGRFKGTDPEPRPSKHAGHVPASLSLPFTAMIDERERTMLPPDRLAQAIVQAGIDPAKPLVATCGTGVTACVIALALYLLGHKEVAVYDGSWAEWGNRDDTPIETG